MIVLERTPGRFPAVIIIGYKICFFLRKLCKHPHSTRMFWNIVLNSIGYLKGFSSDYIQYMQKEVLVQLRQMSVFGKFKKWPYT